jgi:hypothetical protein
MSIPENGQESIGFQLCSKHPTLSTSQGQQFLTQASISVQIQPLPHPPKEVKR